MEHPGTIHVFSHSFFPQLKNLFPRALLHLLTDLAKVYTDQSKAGLASLAKYKHFSKIWVRTFESSPFSSKSSPEPPLNRPRTELPLVGVKIHLSSLIRNFFQRTSIARHFMS